MRVIGRGFNVICPKNYVEIASDINVSSDSIIMLHKNVYTNMENVNICLRAHIYNIINGNNNNLHENLYLI